MVAQNQVTLQLHIVEFLVGSCPGQDLLRNRDKPEAHVRQVHIIVRLGGADQVDGELPVGIISQQSHLGIKAVIIGRLI